MPPPKRLLIVDDDDRNRDWLGRRLIRSGYHVRPASGGKQALELLASEPIDLVLLDLMMPDMGGLEVLRQIRGSRPAAELPVIIVTANHESEGVVAALRAGANDYLTKPVDFAAAQASIETGLLQAAADREQRRQMELYRLASLACEDGLWDWDLRARVIEYSPRWKAMLGFAEGEISCDPEEWFSRLHPDDRERVQNQVRNHLEGATGHLVSEYRMRHKDGSWRWLENRGSAARDEEGRPVRLAGCQADITARTTIDPLTSLRNRAWLEAELCELGNRCQQAALLLFDLEGFERVEASLRGRGRAVPGSARGPAARADRRLCGGAGGVPGAFRRA